MDTAVCIDGFYTVSVKEYYLSLKKASELGRRDLLWQAMMSYDKSHAFGWA